MSSTSQIGITARGRRHALACGCREVVPSGGFCYSPAVNVDRILTAMNTQGVQYLLVGGVNFLLRHAPVLTFDVDLWIADTVENRRRCESALLTLEAAWGPTETDWGPVARLPSDWLARQSMFAMTTAHGAVDIFRNLRGLPDWMAAYRASVEGETAAGTPYRGLSDTDMLTCQEALEPADRRQDRIQALRRALGRQP